ncbi:MoxR-like ATPase [Halopolyspora algeriensis]|uniref:MoxR-like ATPase n=1 Tax=Halopolyspora algeriensis TaxID=1500506 RepID=A0A368VJN0_9ACTN|nr:MoxR family ATPase [Halopolyspora algeriensis]RCW40972.1 MoxR-like ATPase [Halopolyspora algeriensis]TQM53944.1 MoxR-like ATPase [Halopolyspora algeriensis]
MSAGSDQEDVPAGFESIDEVTESFAEAGYLTDTRLATTIFLTTRLAKPLLLEGPAGVGKTELATKLAAVTGRRLLRLQCYEGQDETKALYEWDYGKQLLYTQMLREKISEIIADTPDLDSAVEAIGKQDDVFFSDRFLTPRPLLDAIRGDEPAVLLVDEVDRADEALEAVLLECLGEYQVSVPEIGTYTAKTPPLVVLTSNNTRDLSAALKRRCLHLFLDYPDANRELEIIKSKRTGLPEVAAHRLVEVVRDIRELPLRKAPSISETIDWARTLAVLGVEELDPSVLADTANVVLKYERDLDKARELMPLLRDPNRTVPEQHSHDHGHGHGHHHSHAHGERVATETAPAGTDDKDYGKQVRAAKDRPGRHDEGYYGSTTSAPVQRRNSGVSSEQGSRSWAPHARKRPF